jgi:uncharacterized repeat protein (TIGR03943 family)
MKRYLSAITIFLFGVYLLKLTFTNGLQLYINENNIWYTALSGFVCFFIGIMGLVVTIKEKTHHEGHKKWRLSGIVLSIPLFAALILGLVLPAAPIVYNASNFTPIKPPPYESNKDVQDEVIARLLGFNTDKYTFAEWYLTESLSPDYHYQDGKPLDLTGQIFTIDSTRHIFYFGRLYITCCVIDARPFAFPVHYLLMQGQSVPYQQNEWLRVQGSFSVGKVNGENELAITPFSIVAVPKPKKPYVN